MRMGDILQNYRLYKEQSTLTMLALTHVGKTNDWFLYETEHWTERFNPVSE